MYTGSGHAFKLIQQVYHVTEKLILNARCTGNRHKGEQLLSTFTEPFQAND